MAAAQRRQRIHSRLAAKWEARLSNELFDIAPEEDFLNATTYKDGTKKFFFCDGRKEDVRKIEKGRVRLRHKSQGGEGAGNSISGSLDENMSINTSSSGYFTNNNASNTKTNGSISDNSAPEKNIFNNLLQTHSTNDLLQASFQKPTLRGDSFGPGDAHKRARANYYHVLDSLPPAELTVGECPNPLIYYKDSAPPPIKEEGSLLCGISGE